MSVLLCRAMRIYDKTSIAFILKAESMAREILLSIGIDVKRNRFLYNGYFYPINIVVFEGKEWGHFDGDYWQIALNRKLIYLAQDSVVRDVLKHELAHYLTRILFGPDVMPHGAEFKETCRRFHFPDEVSKATLDVELANESKEGDLNGQRVVEKIKKLLALAQSSNAHEAELATLKANELLLRHNIEHIESTEAPIYLDRVLIKKRKDAKMVAIHDILRHFVVRTVFSMGRGSCSLEASGPYTNVILARYVAQFLDRELERLWIETKKEQNFKSTLRAKNSFFYGVAKGFDQKMKTSKEGLSSIDQKALMVVENKLKVDTSIIYGRLSTSYSGFTIDEAARSVGISKGQKLTINKGVESTSKKLTLSMN